MPQNSQIPYAPVKLYISHIKPIFSDSVTHNVNEFIACSKTLILYLNCRFFSYYHHTGFNGKSSSFAYPLESRILANLKKPLFQMVEEIEFS